MVPSTPGVKHAPDSRTRSAHQAIVLVKDCTSVPSFPKRYKVQLANVFAAANRSPSVNAKTPVNVSLTCDNNMRENDAGIPNELKRCEKTRNVQWHV